MVGDRTRRTAIVILAALLLSTPAVPAPATADLGVDVTETDEAIEVDARAYEAVVDLPYGNLAEVLNAAGHRLVGTDGPMVQGVTVRWPDARQQDGGGMAEPEISVDGNRVTVDHDRFDATYRFEPEQIHVEVRVSSEVPLGVDVGSPLEPSRNASRRLSLDPYDRIGAYPTDFATDRSEGQFAIWPTATSTVGNAHTYRPYMLEPVLEGRCRWYTTKGVVEVGRTAAHDVGSPGYAERCYVGNQTDAEAEGQVVRDATHQVMQSFDNLQAGDTLAFTLAVDTRGYDIREVRYPISTQARGNTGNTTAKLLVPWDKPADGYRLAIYHPGHWDDKYRHSYLWDLLANHGFIVATPFTTANMGEVHSRHDWGYTSQIEFTDLRRWVIDNHDVDEDRVHSVGISLGGLNALLDAVNNPNAYASTVWYDGLYDFERFWLASPLGTPSTALGAEIGSCCGTVPRNASEHYAWDIRDPKLRIDQFRGELLVVHGAADWVVPLGQALELHRDVPGSTLKVAAATHDDNGFAGFRKAALDQLLDAERDPDRTDRYDAVVYGRPDVVPVGYDAMPEPLNWSTDWLRVWAPDEAFVHVQAERGPEGVTVQANRSIRVAVEVPEACGSPCEVTVGDRTVAVEDASYFDSGRAAILEVGPDAPASATFLEAAPEPLPSDATPGETTPTSLGPVLVAVAAAVLILRRRRTR